MPVVLGQDERVTRWVAEQAGSGTPRESCASIGYEVDGDLVAGVYFTDCTETNVFAHIAAVTSALPIPLLAACGQYAFVQLGAERMTFLVRDTNLRCLRLVGRLGAFPEGVIKRGHAGGDVLVFALWRDRTPLFHRLVNAGRIEVPHGQLEAAAA